MNSLRGVTPRGCCSCRVGAATHIHEICSGCANNFSRLTPVIIYRGEVFAFGAGRRSPNKIIFVADATSASGNLVDVEIRTGAEPRSRSFARGLRVGPGLFADAITANLGGSAGVLHGRRCFPRKQIIGGSCVTLQSSAGRARAVHCDCTRRSVPELGQDYHQRQETAWHIGSVGADLSPVDTVASKNGGNCVTLCVSCLCKVCFSLHTVPG